MDESKQPGLDPRRAVILAAAEELFFELGFAATSIDAIVERAGGSKRTIYEMFGNKEGLLEALISEATEEVHGASVIRDIQAPLEESLLIFARQLLSLFKQPKTAKLYRLVIAETTRLPALAETYYRLGAGRGRIWLAGHLERAQQRGEIGELDIEAAARQFLGLVKEEFYFEVVLGLRGPLTDDEVEERAKMAVRTFLYGIGRQ